MRYAVLVQIEVDSGSDQQANELALKLRGLLEAPLVKMAVEGEGIRLAPGGRITVFQPQRIG